MKISKTFLIGLLGKGITATRSPEIHQSESVALGQVLIYKPVDFEQYHIDDGDLNKVIIAAEYFGFNGLNITHPFKQVVIPLLDELSPEATIIGSVNSIVFRDGRRIGHNTDWFGFAENFKASFADVNMQKVVQLGAGGAGAAVAYALLHLGVHELFIVDINLQRAGTLALRMQAHFPVSKITAIANAADVIHRSNGVVQTTPVGMLSHPGVPFDTGLLKPSHWLAEIIYFPIETEILKYARSIGCKTISGGGMAVFQAAKAFELFTGIKPDVKRMLRRFGGDG